MKDCPCCPGLWNIRAAGKEDRKVHFAPPIDAREHFGRTVGVETQHGIKDAANDLIHLGVQPVALEACRDNRIILRPD